MSSRQCRGGGGSSSGANVNLSSRPQTLHRYLHVDLAHLARLGRRRAAWAWSRRAACRSRFSTGRTTTTQHRRATQTTRQPPTRSSDHAGPALPVIAADPWTQPRRSMMRARWPCRRPRTSSAGRSGRRCARARVSSVVISRAPEQPSGWPRAIAPPLTLTRSMSGWSSLLPGQHDRGERLVDLDQVDVVDRQPGPLEHLLRWPGSARSASAAGRRRRARSRRSGPAA